MLMQELHPSEFAFLMFVKKVVSVEENEKSCKLAEIVARENDILNLEIHNEDAADFFKNEKRKFDVIILDPPRKGCTTASLDEAFRLCKNTIIYVSCNPATLARDLKYLTEKRLQKYNQSSHLICFHIPTILKM